ncbi:DUF6559 family protein [Photobacterium galatheae]|uniref:DUF6559 family protein n=1 Tax=Photobacterium galatheae TaxID=1654360 RepID=UPI0012680A88|nr:DUF6559 family protein [Photobacterium galatheae]MCM0147079.1 hypothetical protein [Photobacterium galatheae]
MFGLFFRNRKIKRYAKRLPVDLKKRYGKKKYYSRSQVDRALSRQRLRGTSDNISSSDYYVYAMYCSPREFSQICHSTETNHDYHQMRREISEVVFGRQTEFTFSALEIEYGSGSSSDGTGDFGGDGGCGGGD